MLCMSAMGGFVAFATPAMASVAQAPTIKVSGQVVTRANRSWEPPSK